MQHMRSRHPDIEVSVCVCVCVWRGEGVECVTNTSVINGVSASARERLRRVATNQGDI